MWCGSGLASSAFDVLCPCLPASLAPAHPLATSPLLLSSRTRRQLGREGDQETYDWHGAHAAFEEPAPQVQERLPGGHDGLQEGQRVDARLSAVRPLCLPLSRRGLAAPRLRLQQRGPSSSEQSLRVIVGTCVDRGFYSLGARPPVWPQRRPPLSPPLLCTRRTADCVFSLRLVRAQPNRSRLAPAVLAHCLIGTFVLKT